MWTRPPIAVAAVAVVVVAEEVMEAAAVDIVEEVEVMVADKEVRFGTLTYD